MKLFIAAAALIIAMPAAAAQNADPHAGHKGQQQGHEQHGEHKMDCCKDKNGNGKPDCCDAAKDGTRMKCCEEAAKKGKSSGADHSGH